MNKREKTKQIIIPYLNDYEKENIIDKRIKTLGIEIILLKKRDILNDIQNMVKTNNLNNELFNDSIDEKKPPFRVTDFAILYYIIKNYNKLPDYSIYIKAHQIKQGGGWNNFLDEIHNLQPYKQMGKINRKFIHCYGSFLSSYSGNFHEQCDQFVKEYYPSFKRKQWLKLIEKTPNNSLFLNDKNEQLFIQNSSLKKMFRQYYDLLERTIGINKNKIPLSDLISEYIEGSIILSRDVIRYHPLETYEMLLEFYVKNPGQHDRMVNFYHYFFKRTMEKMIKK